MERLNGQEGHTVMVANSQYIVVACMVWFAPQVMSSDKVQIEEVMKDGQVVEVHFYGPASWLAEPGERFGKFPNLRSVILQCGAIRAEEMRYIATCKSVESIATFERFESNSASFLPGALNELSQMTWLKTLCIYSEPMENSEWKFLMNLQSLESLTVEGIEESGIEYLRGLKTLSSLRLHQCEILRVPDAVSTVACLQEFSLTQPFPSKPLDSESLEHLAKLEQLRSLTISGIQDSGIERIAKLSRLRFLFITISDSNAKLDQLGELKELTSFTLNSGVLINPDLSFIKNFKKIQFLQLLVRDDGSRNVSRTVPYEFLSDITQLSIGSNVDAETLFRIASLPKLTRLTVRGLVGDCGTGIATLVRRSIKLEVGGRKIGEGVQSNQERSNGSGLFDESAGQN